MKTCGDCKWFGTAYRDRDGNEGSCDCERIPGWLASRVTNKLWDWSIVKADAEYDCPCWEEDDVKNIEVSILAMLKEES